MFFFLDELFTLHLSLFAFPSVPIESTNVTSVFAMLESLQGFVLLQTFVTDFTCSYVQETNKTYTPLDGPAVL